MKIYIVLFICTSLALGNCLGIESHHSSLTSSKTAHCRLENNELTCLGGIDNTWSSRGDEVEVLVVSNWPDTTFNPDHVLQAFPSIQKFSLINSNISKLTSTFSSQLKFLETVNLTGTKLKELSRGSFSQLDTLKIIDLRNNALREIDPEAFPASTLDRLYLSGNPLSCTEKMAWILDWTMDDRFGQKIVDKDNLHCSQPYHQRPLLPVLRVIMALKEECKRTVCECELVYVVGRATGKRADKQSEGLMVFNSLNCSHRGLVEMPNFLPANTTTLRLNDNKIADLSALTANPLYERVLDLYLDNNEITSISQLEGSYWLDHFRLLSLRGNRLIDLPTYALENALLQSNTAVSLYLGKNPWRCDCLFTPGFQDLLARYTTLIKDIDDLKCSELEDEDLSGKQIRYLTRTELCTSSEDDPWIHPLDVLNIVLASLIILVLGKLIYDYWSFKKTGKLPWIVAKMP